VVGRQVDGLADRLVVGEPAAAGEVLGERVDLPLHQPRGVVAEGPGDRDRELLVEDPVAHQGEEPVDGEQVAVGEGLGVRPDVGEAHRPPQPADVVDRHVGERSHRVAGVPARAAQQPLLDLSDVDVRGRLVLRRLDHGMSEEELTSLPSPRRRSSSASASL
jgi:hypothetical protein